MRIELNRVNDAVHLEAVNEDGNVVSIDGSPAVGGTKSGFRPMQMLLAGLGGCSAIDFIDILKKQRQDLRDIRIIIDAQREDKPAPSVFTSIHMHFKLQGTLDVRKVERALDLSVEKYCSVGKILEKTARITYSYEIEIDEHSNG
jgi:putative redox protein